MLIRLKNSTKIEGVMYSTIIISEIEFAVGMARILHSFFSPISNDSSDDGAIRWVLERRPMERNSVSSEMKEYDVAQF